MKHRNPLLRFAASVNYATLYLPDGTRIGPGEPAWRRFVEARNQKRLLLLYQRIQRWQELANEERTA